MRRAPSKYHARRTTVEGITFHSAKEARRYQELRLLEKAGEIRGLKLQAEFLLQAPTAKPGIVSVVGAYLADFEYDEQFPKNRWYRVVEDVKGYDTPLSKWKRKHVKAQYGIEVRLT